MSFPNPVREIEDYLERHIYGPRRQLQETINAFMDPLATTRRWVAELKSARDAELTGIVLPTRRERDAERIRVLEEQASELQDEVQQLRDDSPPTPKEDDLADPGLHTGVYL